MPYQSLEDYFSDAPYFRPHEGMIGALYRLKSHPLGAGLWFAESDMRLEIARRKPMPLRSGSRLLEDLDGYKTRAAALENYSLNTIDIQKGDAVIDEFLFLRQEKTSAEDISSLSADAFYQRYHDSGALIHLHIPRQEFNARYVFDDVEKQYRRKSYQIKFAAADTFLQTPEGIEQVKKHSALRFEKGDLSVQALSAFPGMDERVICGQPLIFYLNEADAFENKEPDPLDELHHLTQGLSLTFRQQDGVMKAPNPYGSLKDIYDKAARRFDTAPILSAEQSGEFKAHHRDVLQRFAYFEAHPL